MNMPAFLYPLLAAQHIAASQSAFKGRYQDERTFSDIRLRRVICNELKNAVKDEEDGVKSYKYLQNDLKRLGLIEQSAIIGRIAKTEAGHKKEVQRIYNKLCREVV